MRNQPIRPAFASVAVIVASISAAAAGPQWEWDAEAAPWLTPDTRPEAAGIPGQANCFATSCSPVPCYGLPFGVVDLADIVGFTQAFFNNDPIADIAQPFGELDLLDISDFVLLFLNGCP